MSKPAMTPQEAQKWFEANKDRLRKKFEQMEDPPAEITPDGVLIGPKTELDDQRVLSDLRESEEEGK